MDDLTIFVCTYNSSSTVERCLTGIKRSAPRARLVVIDHNSTDDTVEIAERFSASIYVEEVSLGYARQVAFNIVQTKFLAFVDGDVEVVEPTFFERSFQELGNPKVGAVVGMALRHTIPYGLPAGLLVLRTDDFRGKVIPAEIDARETYYIQHRLDLLGLKTAYLADAMIHESQFRRFKPEWEGANTRLACGVEVNQLLFALKVVLLMSLNSGSMKNMLYVPIFYLKFLRGFANPQPWSRLKRGFD